MMITDSSRSDAAAAGLNCASRSKSHACVPTPVLRALNRVRIILVTVPWCPIVHPNGSLLDGDQVVSAMPMRQLSRGRQHVTGCYVQVPFAFVPFDALH